MKIDEYAHNNNIFIEQLLLFILEYAEQRKQISYGD